MCNSMRQPTGSSGFDDFTAKCQALNRSFYASEGVTFGWWRRCSPSDIIAAMMMILRSKKQAH